MSIQSRGGEQETSTSEKRCAICGAPWVLGHRCKATSSQGATPSPAAVSEQQSSPANGPAGDVPISPSQVGRGIQTVCTEHAYGSDVRLSFQIKVF